MEGHQIRISCHACSKVVESSGEPACEVLVGWITISHWKGPEAVSRHSFCSLQCLKTWVDAQTPDIPEAFLKSFGESP
jgi:hypothetical protein